MPKLSSSEFAILEARMRAKMPGAPCLEQNRACDHEADLHDAIVTECRRRGWIAFHSRMDRRTGRTLGEPDFIILAEHGRLFCIECKSRNGKLSSEQLGVIAWAEKLGHAIVAIKSFDDFLIQVDKSL